MSKRKKTREQKIISDLRRKITLSRQPNQIKTSTQDVNSETPQKAFTFSIPSIMPQKNNVQSSTIYPYLFSDLRKTTALTGLILCVELLLFFLMKNHLLTLFSLGN